MNFLSRCIVWPVRFTLCRLVASLAVSLVGMQAFGQEIATVPPVVGSSFEAQGIEQYRQVIAQAQRANRLALPSHPQLVRLNYVLDRVRQVVPMASMGAIAAD